MNVIKALGKATALLLAPLLIVVFFSIHEERFRCSGGLVSSSESVQSELFLKLDRYRWWVSLWNKSDGAAWIELPNRTVDYFSDLRLMGDILWLGDERRPLAGSFSTLSKAVQIDISDSERFSGRCVEIED